MIHPSQTPTLLTDTFGRVARKLRLSVTDRCNFRCTYCMPLEPIWLSKSDILTFEEVSRITRIAASCGIRKVRITGGEPLMRKNLWKLITMLGKIPHPPSISLTTNGYFLSEQAESLRQAGLDNINVSFDTLRRKRFQEMARFDGLDTVIQGLQTAKSLGFHVKLNAVIERHKNDDEISALCAFAREHGFVIRFIEYMPLDGERNWSRTKLVSQREILQQAERIAPLLPCRDQDAASPAKRWKFSDGTGEIGIIASVTQPFCRHCDRIRVTADGKLRTCLFAMTETNLLAALRSGARDDAIADMIRSAVSRKQEGHMINSGAFQRPDRAMNAIGG